MMAARTIEAAQVDEYWLGARRVKVGDRVRCLHSDGTAYSKGDEFVVTAVDDNGHIRFHDNEGDMRLRHLSEFEVLPVAGAINKPAFKVGDRVRLIKDGLSTTGAVGKLATIKSWSDGKVMDRGEYLLDIDGPVDYKTLSVTPQYTRAGPECFELLVPAFTIEAGKYYRTRDGRKVGPMVNFGWKDGYPWSTYSTKDTYYSDSGQAQGSGDVNNLVAEWSDEPTHDPADEPADAQSPGEASVPTDKIVTIVFDADTSKMEAKLDRVIEKLERINALREDAA